MFFLLLETHQSAMKAHSSASANNNIHCWTHPKLAGGKATRALPNENWRASIKITPYRSNCASRTHTSQICLRCWPVGPFGIYECQFWLAGSASRSCVCLLLALWGECALLPEMIWRCRNVVVNYHGPELNGKRWHGRANCSWLDVMGKCCCLLWREWAQAALMLAGEHQIWHAEVAYWNCCENVYCYTWNHTTLFYYTQCFIFVEIN